MTGRASPAAPRPPAAARLSSWGLDPAWSRHVTVGSGDTTHRWHVLDTGVGWRAPTVVCVHGNPTWSWTWGSFLHRFAADGYRVVAPDLLGMGFSDRTAEPRRYAVRVADLDDLLAALDVAGPVVLVGHDWGGAIAMGWAVGHRDRVAAMILANTGIAVPAGRTAPGIIRLVATRGVHDLVTRRTAAFVRGTGRLSRGRLSEVDREALVAPYRRAEHRAAIANFVADIPFDPGHPSAAAVDAVASSLGSLEAPVLLLWGGRDPVFDDDFAADLIERMPHADLHRFPAAGHLVVPETVTTPGGGTAPSAADVAATWLAAGDGHRRRRPRAERAATGAGAPESWRPAWAAIGERAVTGAGDVAFHDGSSGRSVTFGELDELTETVAARLRERGVERGDRVAVLVPPSVELLALVYGCWRAGSVTVIADRGLGLGGLGGAIRSARVDAVVGPRRALTAARVLRWAPAATSIDVTELVGAGDAGDDAARPVDRTRRAADVPGPDDPAAVLFTSGATGPAKGVRYTHGRLAAQRDALAELYRIGPDDRFVAAFAPFALYGPALGITSAVPDVDVTAPGALTAAALDRACAEIEATMVFASPAALANVVRTADGPVLALAAVRTVMSAGAPVPIGTLRAMAQLAPAAELHTPYGMTEVLPVADIDLAGIEASLAGGAAGPGGVCVGRPVPGCEVRIVAAGDAGDLGHAADDGDVGDAGDVGAVAAAATAGDADGCVGRTGEILVSAPWMSNGYDAAWSTEHRSRPVDAGGREWHRSGDVGHLDADGRLWVEGRAVHVVHTVDGPLTSVPAEVAVETLDAVGRAAVVGVGPAGVQQVVVVVELAGVVGRAVRRRPSTRTRRGRALGDLALAELELATRVRAVLDPLPVAAVCTARALPVDIRHNAKIDRAAVAVAVSELLAGRGAPNVERHHRRGS